ncbi:MAG: hypothetical protein ACMXYL_04510 [Candidatus Woesearchaeota archaeon]
MSEENNRKEKSQDDNKASIREYVNSINNYVQVMSQDSMVLDTQTVPYFRTEAMSIDRRVDEELRVLKDMDRVSFEIERMLALDSAPPSKKAIMGLKYGLSGKVPFFRKNDVSLSELLLQQSATISRACGTLDKHTKQYDAITERLGMYEERLYNTTEVLANRKDDLNKRIVDTNAILEEHIQSKIENPTESERNAWILDKNRLQRALTDLHAQDQLSGQQYALAMDQAQTVNNMIDYMKAQSTVCKAIYIMGTTVSEYLKETAEIHDTAQGMQGSSSSLIGHLETAGRAVGVLGELRNQQQIMTMERIEDYMGNSDGSGYRKTLEGPTKEAQQLMKKMRSSNEKTISKIYESEYKP